jgi:hypothetical protein
MSLRKSPTRTPAFLEAIHRHAQKSTGPWTVRGKAQSCLNRLKTGARFKKAKTSHAKAQRRGDAKRTKHLSLRLREIAK